MTTRRKCASLVGPIEAALCTICKLASYTVISELLPFSKKRLAYG